MVVVICSYNRKNKKLGDKIMGNSAQEPPSPKGTINQTEEKFKTVENDIEQKRKEFNLAVDINEFIGIPEYQNLVNNIVDCLVYQKNETFREGKIRLKDGKEFEFMSYKYISSYESKFSETLPNYKKYLILSPKKINTDKCMENVWDLWGNGDLAFVFEKKNNLSKIISITTVQDNVKETNFYTTNQTWFGKDWALKSRKSNKEIVAHKTIIKATMFDRSYSPIEAYLYENNFLDNTLNKNPIELIEENQFDVTSTLISIFAINKKQNLALNDVKKAIQPTVTAERFF